MASFKGFKYVPVVTLAGCVGLIALSNGCSAANAVAGAAQGCDEFPGSVATLSLDGTTQAFVQSGADLTLIASSMEAAVMKSCIAIDTDLGVTDTWTAMAPTDGSAPDNEMKEACSQASTKINAILAAGASAQITCGLSVTGGGCQVSADVQAKCEANCSVSASCSPGSISVTARCSPGDLEVQCAGTCNAGATCEGTVTAPVVNCTGTCSAQCSGTCDVSASAPSVDCSGTCGGKCSGTCDGVATPAGSSATCAGDCEGKCDAKCTYKSGAVNAHCTGTCTGGCTGGCTATPGSAGISCGASVSCKGGCTGTATAPSCTGELSALPPSCNANANCEGSCQGHAEATASCTPPSVTLACTGTATGDITKLIATLQTNLPILLQAAETQGALAVKAAGHVATAGAAVVANITSTGGKALACASAAVSASAKASVSVNVSVSASASVGSSASGGSGS